MSFAKAFSRFALLAGLATAATAATQASAVTVVNNEAGTIFLFVQQGTPNYQYSCTGVDWSTQCQTGWHTQADGWHPLAPHAQLTINSNANTCIGVNYGGDFVGARTVNNYAFGFFVSSAWVSPGLSFSVGYTPTGHGNDVWMYPIVINGQHQQEGGGGLDWGSALANFQAIGLQNFHCVLPNQAPAVYF